MFPGVYAAISNPNPIITLGSFATFESVAFFAI
jgi:hypothetical protein